MICHVGTSIEISHDIIKIMFLRSFEGQGLLKTLQKDFFGLRNFEPKIPVCSQNRTEIGQWESYCMNHTVGTT